MIRFISALAFLFTALTLNARNPIEPVKPQRVIDIKVIPSGTIFMGVDTLRAEGLSKVLQDRLWKSYVGMGKMYDAINLTFEGNVPQSFRSATISAIKTAQQKALTELCVEKYEKEYVNLEQKQKDKIRKQFPVLFQTF
jgi:hypothetical protein